LDLIFLIGYRGSGKTTVARLLAGKLGWGWTDADEVLEQQCARSIREVFAEEGEAGFRDREVAVLCDLARLDKHVVATGGGIILRPENRANLRAGKVVWLTATAEVLWERLRGDESTARRRPDLTRGGLAEIEEMLKVRAPLYAACADWTVDAAAKSPEEIADLIYQWFNPEPAATAAPTPSPLAPG
jgi:shikimate kinase